jgi:hypothetical protein
MATIEQIKYLDDLDGTEGATTLSFGLDGKQYQIDLGEENTAQLRDALAPYLAVARKAGSTTAVRPISTARPRKPTVDREQNDAIRDWARKRGFKVADRGRIPAPALAAYHGEHSAA